MPPDCTSCTRQVGIRRKPGGLVITNVVLPPSDPANDISQRKHPKGSNVVASRIDHDLISRTFAIPPEPAGPPSRRTGTAAIRNVSRPVATVKRSIHSTAARAIPSEPAHTAKDRPDVASMRKKLPSPFGTPNRSSTSSGCRCASASGTLCSSCGFGWPSPDASPRPGNWAVFATGVRLSPRHLRLCVRMAFKTRVSSSNGPILQDTQGGLGRYDVHLQPRKPIEVNRRLTSTHCAPAQIHR